MATNKKITQLDELTPATWADDDVIAIVDISAQETKKIQLSTFRGAVTGVSTLNASTPLTVDSATGDVTISVAIDGGGTINAVFDEDNMASNSPTALATQQSIKAYVDSQVGTVDTLAEILANGNTSGGTNIVVSSGDVITTNTISETTAASGVTIDSLLVKDGGITAAGTSTFASQTITDLGAVTTADINGGTIDGTVIGGSSAAAGTFTTFTSTGIDDNASSTAVTIDSSQNVGIGTSLPSSLLHIASTGDAVLIIEADTDNVTENDNPQLRFVQDGGITTARIGFADGTNRMEFVNEVGDGIAFGTSDTERMRILGGGNVGIGTVSPTQALEVAGTIRSSISSALSSYIATTSGGGGFFIEPDDYSAANPVWVIETYTGEPLTFQMGGSERMRITSPAPFSGDVGIGTTAPIVKLHVTSASSGVNPSGNATELFVEGSANSGITIGSGYLSNGRLCFGDSGNAIAGLVGYDHADDSLYFGTNGVNERMTIDSSGNVGIGTAPDSGTPLHVQESSASLPANPTASALLVERAGTVAMTLGTANTGTASIFFGDLDNLTTGRLQYDNSDNSLQFWANSLERMRTDSAGNLLIGTTSATTDLAYTPKLKLSGNGPALYLEEADESQAYAITALSGNLYFRDGTAGATRILIDSAGNVGIGVSTVDTALGTKLHVAGTIRTDTGAAAANPAIVFDHNNFADADANYIMLDRTSEAMRFNVNASERMRIDSSGSIGIGTTAPSGKLHVRSASSGVTPNTTGDELFVEGSGNSGITIGSGTSSNGRLYFGDSGSATSGRVGYDHTSNSLYFGTNGVAERMRIDSSGNVGIGTAAPSSLLHLASTGSAILTLEADTDNVTESHNARIELSQDNGATTGHLGYGSGTNGIDVWNDYNDYVRIGTNNNERLRIVNNGVVRPGTDNLQALGDASYRWSVVYAGTGTINTSDAREKQQIADLDDAERRVAVALKGLVKKYKYNDAVQLKGDDARIHVGVIAQEVIAAFAAEGLDATRYALLCHDTWEAEPEEIDKNGNVINPGIEAGERYGIRYDELLAFMIAAL